MTGAKFQKLTFFCGKDVLDLNLLLFVLDFENCDFPGNLVDFFSAHLKNQLLKDHSIYNSFSSCLFLVLGEGIVPS